MAERWVARPGRSNGRPDEEPLGVPERAYDGGAMRRTILLGTIFALALHAAASGSAQVVDPNLPGTDGQVNAAVLSGNTLYLGGTFTRVGPAVGSGVPLDVGDRIRP